MTLEMSSDYILRLLEPGFDDDAKHPSLFVHRDLCLGPPKKKHLSGGGYAGAAIYALEANTGRPLVQLSVQFLSAPRAESNATLSVAITRTGRSISQANAAITVDGQLSAIVFGTLGSRNSDHDRQWQHSINAVPPEDCQRLPFIREDKNDLHTHLDVRQVKKRDQTSKGSFAFWVRSPTNISNATAAPFLALIADYLPEAIHGSIGKPAGAVSLDNQLRILSRELTEWTLCEIKLAGIADGVSHGRMDLYNQSGELLAIGEQSSVVVFF